MIEITYLFINGTTGWLNTTTLGVEYVDRENDPYYVLTTDTKILQVACNNTQYPLHYFIGHDHLDISGLDVTEVIPSVGEITFPEGNLGVIVNNDTPLEVTILNSGVPVVNPVTIEGGDTILTPLLVTLGDDPIPVTLPAGGLEVKVTNALADSIPVHFTNEVLIVSADLNSTGLEVQVMNIPLVDQVRGYSIISCSDPVINFDTALFNVPIRDIASIETNPSYTTGIPIQNEWKMPPLWWNEGSFDYASLLRMKNGDMLYLLDISLRWDQILGSTEDILQVSLPPVPGPEIEQFWWIYKDDQNHGYLQLSSLSGDYNSIIPLSTIVEIWFEAYTDGVYPYTAHIRFSDHSSIVVTASKLIAYQLMNWHKAPWGRHQRIALSGGTWTPGEELSWRPTT